MWHGWGGILVPLSPDLCVEVPTWEVVGTIPLLPGRVNQWLLLLPMAMECRNPCKTGGFRGFRQVLVTLQADSHSNLGFGPDHIRRSERCRGDGPCDAQNAALAAYRHAFAKSDLRWHPEREFDFGAFGKRRVREEKNPARTQILGEADTFNQGCRLSQ